MRHLQSTLLACLAFVLLASHGTGDELNRISNASQLILGEGSSSSNGLTVTSGNVVMKSGRPGVAFAFVTKPGQATEFAYFLVFSHDFPIGNVKSQCNSNGLTANTHHAISAFGNNLNVQFRIALDPDTKKTAKMETTIVAKQSKEAFDPSKGKVFLVNMKASPPRIEQVRADLPSHTPKLNTAGAVATFSETTLMRLCEENNTVDAFCKQIEGGS